MSQFSTNQQQLLHGLLLRNGDYLPVTGGSSRCVVPVCIPHMGTHVRHESETGKILQEVSVGTVVPWSSLYSVAMV